MLNLLLAILCSASIALLFKISENRDYNRYLVTSANYFFGGIIAVILWLFQPGSASAIFADPSVRNLLLLSVATGIVYYLGFLYYQISVRRHGVGLAGAYAKLGIFLPLILSLFIWREWPGAWQWAGIICAAIAILFVNMYPLLLAEKRERDWLKPSLLALFFLGGFAEFSSKIFRQLVNPELKPVFLLLVFAVALITSLTGLLRNRKDLSLPAMLLGFAVGIPNIFTAYFLISALGELPAALVYAVFGAGTIMVVGTAGWLFWQEWPERHERLGFTLIVIAMIISNF